MVIMGIETSSTRGVWLWLMPSCGVIRGIVEVIVTIGLTWNGSRGNVSALVISGHVAAVGMSLFRVDFLVD